MTHRPAGPVATVLVAAGLLAGCSGVDDEPAPTPSITPSSAGTAPSLPPRSSATLPSGVIPTPSSGTGAPIPVPTVPPG